LTFSSGRRGGGSERASGGAAQTPKECYRAVTMVLQWCHSGVTVVLELCYSCVRVVLQWCYSGRRSGRGEGGERAFGGAAQTPDSRRML
jgi:hypothetical protein